MLIDLYKKDTEYKYTLTLCKPNKTPMVVLNEAYGITYNAKFNDIDELSFNIPRVIQDNFSHQFIDNPNYDLIKGDFLILMETNNISKYFVIEKPSEEGGDKDYKSVNCSSQEIILNKRYLRLFKGTRQLYNPVIYYSWDNVTWTKYTTDSVLNASGKTHIYVKTKDFSNTNDVLSDTAIAVKNYINNGIGINIRNSSGTPSHLEIIISRSGETGDGILNVLENETMWKVGYVDYYAYRDTTTGQNHNKYRTFDVSENAWLDFMRTELSEAFDCVFIFDTTNMKVNVYSIDTLSVDKGLYISEANYLKKINKEPNFDNVYTRLKIYGKDNISINSVNPTGMDYLEDFSYYMNNGYMTDSLVTAINNYNTLLESKKSTFSTYLSQLSAQQTILDTKQTESANLKGELQVILDNIDVAIQAGQSLTTLNQQKAAKQEQINTKQSEINSVNSEINAINSNISTLATLLSKSSNFTTDQLTELDYFIKEKTWTNNNYSDSVSLMEAGKKALSEVNQPIVEFKVDLVDLFNVVECQYEWDRLTLGSLVNVHYSNLDIDIQVRVIGYSHNADGGLSVEFSNKDKKKDALRYLGDSIADAIQSSTTVGLNKINWDKSEGTANWVEEFKVSALDASKNAVLSGRNQNIRIDERGIALSDLTNSNEQMRIINNCLAMTLDNWDTASLSVTPHGLIAKMLLGEIILGQKLRLTDELGQFKIDSNLLQIIDNLNRVRVKLGEYESGKYGLLLYNKSGNSVVVSEDGIIQTDTVMLAENVDENHPLKLKIYIPPEVLEVRSVKLNFSLENFRADSKSVVGGGGGSTTVTSGGGGSYSNTITSEEEAFNSNLPIATSLPKGGVTTPYDEYHYHEVNRSTLIHTHSLGITIPNHTHQVSVPNHSHPVSLLYGIYEGSQAQDTNIYINGVLRDASGYSDYENTVDITQWITGSGWQEIILTSTTLGRINAAVNMVVFMST